MPYASIAHTSISPSRCPPNCALPPSGCCVTSEYGPIERAWILSSTRWWSFSMYMTPTVTSWSNASPVRPSKSTVCPLVGQARERERVLDLRSPARRRRRGSRSGRRACSLVASARTSSSRELGEPLRDVLVAVEDLLDVLAHRVAAPNFSSSMYRSCAPEHARAPAEVRLEDLSDVHAARNAERVEDDVDRACRPAGTACPPPAGCGEMTPLLPWRPAILSPTWSFLLMAM